jgi:GTP:adenosylcobinamide-phosphate guanylyltransferase
MNAVMLAGGPADAVAALYPGTANKAFVPIAGIPLVERALSALRAVARIERIVVVAPAHMHGAPALRAADECRVDGRRMIESLASGLAGFPVGQPVLVVASYHDACHAHIPHTWARLREGQFCGGGVSAIKPRALDRLAEVLDALGAARKAPLRLAALFGWDVLARFALGRLSIAEAERRASAILRVPVGAVRCTHAEIAINVDRPGDVALAEELLAGASIGARP